MNRQKNLLFTALALTLPAWTLCAQDNAPVPPNVPQPPPNPAPQAAPTRDGGPQRPGGQRGEGFGERRRLPAFFELLDANHDGVIDAEELKNAPEVLKKLDQKGDGKLTLEEFFGGGMRRPQGDNPQARGPQPGQPGQPGQERP